VLAIVIDTCQAWNEAVMFSICSTRAERRYSTIGNEDVVPMDFVADERMPTYHSSPDCTC